MITEEQVLQKIEQWASRHIQPDFLRMERRGELNVRIWIDPWWGLKKRNPPLDLQGLILERMILIFHSWRKVFLQAKKPVDLQLILFEEAFIRSEVTAIQVPTIGKLQAPGFHPAHEIRRFPYELFFENRDALRDFEWRLFWEGEYLHPEVDELNQLDIERYLAEGFRKEWPNGRKDGGNYLLFRPTDRVWVGRWVL